MHTSCSPKRILAFLLVMAMALGFALAASAAGEETTDAGGQWKYVVVDGNATLTGFVEELGYVLVIPGEVDGYPVTAIGEGAFRECWLIDVILPGSVASIGDFAFAGGYDTMLVRLPDSVTHISPSAFERAGITVLMLKEGSYAEAYADEVDIRYFYDDEADEIAVWEWSYALEGGDAVITGYPLVSGWAEMPIGTLPIPAVLDGHPVTAIGDRAFAHTYNLTGLTVPEGVTRIGAEAFYLCFRLTEVTLPASVTRIGEMAFELHEDGGAWGLTLRVPAGSYAERYAKEQGIPCVFLE